MRIDHLELINFKKYRHLKADFGSGVNLLVGVNGAGKTSVLEGLSVAVGVFFKSRESQKVQRYIDLSELRIENGVRVEQSEVSAESEQVPGGPWKRTFLLKTLSNRSDNTQILSGQGELVFLAFEFESEGTIAPIIAYYPTQRLFKDANRSKRQRYDSKMGRQNGYLEALSGKSIKQVITEWWGNAATRRATFQIKGIDNVDLVLENVESALQWALSQLGFANLDFKVYQEPDWDNELFVQLERGSALPLAYYSDGFRNLIFLIVDIIWRASQLNPTLSLKEISNRVDGVVMIDEIDLHLHPKWQAEAIPILQKLLPEVQFFITTHSPTVIANFNQGQLYILEEDSVHLSQEKYFGKDIDSIQRNILGADERNKSVEMRLNELFRMIDEEHPKANVLLKLSGMIDLLGKDDADIQRALSLLEWNEIKSEERDAVH